MKNSLFLTFVLFSSFSISEEIKISVIVENCKSCHGIDLKGNKYIPSLISIEKSYFISKMNYYRTIKDNSVKNRISKVLSINDIKQIAEFIYNKNEIKKTIP